MTQMKQGKYDDLWYKAYVVTKTFNALADDPDNDQLFDDYTKAFDDLELYIATHYSDGSKYNALVKKIY